MQYVTITLGKHRYSFDDFSQSDVMSPAPVKEEPTTFNINYKSKKLIFNKYSAVTFSKVEEETFPHTDNIHEPACEDTVYPTTTPENTYLEFESTPSPALLAEEYTTDAKADEIVAADTVPLSKKELRRQEKKNKKAEKLAKKEEKRVKKMEKKLGRSTDEQPVSGPVPEEKPVKKKRKEKKSDMTKDQLKEKGKGSLKPVKKKFSLYNEVIDEEKVKLEKIDRMINQDGYYDAIPTIDESNKVVVKKKSNKKMSLVAALLGAAVITIIIMVAIVASFF